VFDTGIVAKWREEVRAAMMSDAMVDWCIADLRERQKPFEKVELLHL